jgi:hypothetical protein
MSEFALFSAAFPQAASAAHPQPDHLPVGMAVLTIVSASSLLCVGIVAGVHFLFGF